MLDADRPRKQLSLAMIVYTVQQLLPSLLELSRDDDASSSSVSPEWIGGTLAADLSAVWAGGGMLDVFLRHSSKPQTVSLAGRKAGWNY
jgi:hypothetical protein